MDYLPRDVLGEGTAALHGASAHRRQRGDVEVQGRSGLFVALVEIMKDGPVGFVGFKCELKLCDYWMHGRPFEEWKE
jgi:hypothetical protein